MRDATQQLEPTERMSGALRAVGMPLIAHIAEKQSTRDLAIALCPDRLSIVRCVVRPEPEDHAALATMLSDGDFIYGALVYEEGEPSPSPGPIESFHISQVDQLVTRLVELREAAHEAV